MKRYFKPFFVASIIIISALTLSSCKKSSKQTSAPVRDGSSSTSENSIELELPDNSATNSPTVEKESLTVEIGNDIGRNVSKLSIRPNSESQWTEISIDNGIWKSGYMIPVKIEAESIPIAENGWDIEVTFSDDSSTKVFEGIPFENEKSFILTSDGVVFS
ncbi:MAG: hypothetical protein HFE62_06205 [Firmicutes bacterium]|nr:hypothetical protein [Bacillota bacterium]